MLTRLLRLLLSTVLAFCALELAVAAPPNIVVILVDDLRWDDLGCAGHPFVNTPNIDRIAAEGARFLNAFATMPLCSPSRASLLTGTYAHTHGITDNTDRSPRSHALSTFPQVLQRSGYETAFVGKWHMGNDATPRPGFDFWACLTGQGRSRDPDLNIDGRARHEVGYVTDILHEQAMAFLKQTRTRPFLLYFAHKALHPETVQDAAGALSDPNASNFIPAVRHQDLYAGAIIPRRPSALVPPLDKPALQRKVAGLPPLGPQTGSSDQAILGRLRMLAAVDESLGGILQLLEDSGELQNTLIVVTSDHGYFYGEHGLSIERRLAYEEAIRIPLVMRFPGVIPRHCEPPQLVLTIDLAPTLLELAGAQIPAALEGRSLLPIFKGTASDWRKEILIEYFSDTVFPRIERMGYRAIRTDRWKYIHYTELVGMDELYDLARDPYEMVNRVADPGAQPALLQLERDLTRLAK